MNIRDRRAIHHAAGQSLANAKGDPKRIVLIYLGIITVLSLASSLVSVLLSNRIADTGGLSNMGLRSMLSTAQTVLPLVQSLVFLGLEMGYCIVALRIARGEEFSQDTLFGGFRRFFPLLRAMLLQGFIYFAIGMLALYPSIYIFLMLPISAQFYEIVTPLAENTSILTGTLVLDEATTAAAYDAMMPMFLIYLGVALLIAIPLYYQLRMVTYRLVDQPRPGALAALRESRVMMRRNRFALFKLDLSLWWFYGLQALVMLLCYGDVLLRLVGITLPWSGTVSYFLFLILSLALQFVVYYFAMNRVSVTYAIAYETLLSQNQPQETPAKPPMSANVPWQDQY